MDKIILKVTSREAAGKNSKALRRDKMVPAVVYGGGMDSKSVVVDALDLKRAYDKAGENTVIELSIDDKDKKNVLIYDVQVDPIRGGLTHIDFLQVDMNEEVETEIPLVFEGVSGAVKELGGILITNADVVAVTCLAGNIPHEIKVNISKLATFEDHITIGDLVFPEGVKPVLSADSMIASVSEPRSEQEISDLDSKIEEDVTGVASTKVKKEETEKAE